MKSWLKTGEPEQFKWLSGVITTVFILNVLDGIMTLIWVLTDRAEEANLLMDYLIHIHPVTFMSVKIILVALGIALLWRSRQQRLSVIGIFIVFIVYYFIVVGLHLNAAGIFITNY